MTTGERNNAIVNQLIDGTSVAELAKKYKLSPSTIRAIRSKANASGGLGDVIDEVLHSKALNKITEKLKSAIWEDGKDCGCEERKNTLNKMFPRMVTPLCMTEEMYKSYERIRGLKTLNGEQRKEIAVQHAHLFRHRFVMPCTCSPRRWMEWVDDIEKVYQSYQ